ncbi:oligoendopeptidase F [Petroclostridium sp. X23]|uniref:oligoendopeptidase F n=1 Tax=Petroclostridium sp. X23 TaxID=3045146 RepID=UPI0024ACA67C|nr:oligoendopeptidase F [Petroclostridium sp. X23]WHH58169.1 oligoendopeptidase F [Petroclostridium sp. X23]
MTQHITNKLPKRQEIDAQYTWKLEDIYANNAEWENDFSKIKALIPEIAQYKDKLGDSALKLLEALKLSDQLSSLTEKIFVYARMRRDEDNTNPVYQALTDRAKSLSVQVSGALSFIIPEMISIPEKQLELFLDNEPNLKVYRHYINEITRQKKHVLSQNEEELLAASGEISGTAKDIFTMLNNADIKFPMIKNDKGEEVELTKGNFIHYMESSDRRVREDAFHALYSSYIKQKNTLAASLNGNVKKNIFYSTVRKYPSALEASLDSDNVSVSVYDNLIDTIHDHLHLLHRYVALRKNVLQVDQLHMYDLYTPLVKEMNKHVFYKDALDITLKALQPLGEDYINALKMGYDHRWIDVYENEGKTGGAYSWGAYTTHPYVLLNYQGTLNDVFTLAHEMGHALHSYYTNKYQPYIYSQYKIFVAEVASTVNESLLMQYLLSNTDNADEKAYLINHYLDEFRGTVFRQVMFAEFEKIIHQKSESGEALTPQLLCEVYRQLNIKYFGDNIVIDTDIDMEWSRIPHFYNSFYVYKYATGFSAATSLSRQILEEGQPAVDRYLQFLSSGDSDYPIEILKKAGVDLSTSQPIVDALKVFEEMLNEMEKLIINPIDKVL